MPADVIDTLAIAHELRDAGLPEPQAEAIARQFKRRYDADRQEPVTRPYLDAGLLQVRGEISELRSELRNEIAELRTEVRVKIAKLRGEIADLRTEMTRLERDLLTKLGGLIALSATIVGALGVLF